MSATRVLCCCTRCSKTFELSVSDVARGRGKYCSRSCASADGREIRWSNAKRTLEQRYCDMVIRRGESECWGWKGFKHRGYGRLGIRHAAVGAHRISYEIYVGPIPFGLTVLHRCDNPECSNPRHLFLGTNADNNADRDAKGRTAFGLRNGKAILNPQIVRQVRDQRERGPKVLAEYFGVSVGAIRSVLTGRTWSHVK